MNDLPKNWSWEKLGDVCQIVSGNTPKGLEFISNKGSLQFYKVSDMNLIGNETKMNVSKIKFSVEEVEKLKVKTFPKGTVIFPKRGGAILTNKKRVLSQESSFDLNIMGVLPNQEIDSNYLFYWFIKLDLGRIYDGSNVPQINNKNVAPLNFPKPPLKTQEDIVSKIEELFSDIDKGIEDLKLAQQQLKVYRQSVLKWAFEGKLTNEGVKDGELPEGWKFANLSSVIEKPKYGTSKKCDYITDGKGVLRIPNIAKGNVDSSDLKFAEFDSEEIETYSLKEGDILTIRSNGSVDLVGKCALISKKDEAFLYAGYLIRLRPISNKIIPKYLLHLLSSINLRSQIEDKAKSTSGVNNINSEELSSLKITITSVDEQAKVVQEIENRLSVADKMEESITQSLLQAEALKQSILKKAFKGELI